MVSREEGETAPWYWLLPSGYDAFRGAAMPENVRVDEERGIIVVHSFGEVRFEDVASTARELERIFHKRGLNRTLVDAREQESLPSTTKIYQLASGMLRGMRIALLVGDGFPTEAGMRFAETVARNTGLEWKLFTIETEAVDWLKK